MDKQIQKAKQVEITSLYKGQLRQTGKSLIGQCPFHEDRVASFAVYPQTNTYFCFSGCGFGDAIEFYRKTYKVDFKTAVKELSHGI
jgi:DNA primase